MNFLIVNGGVILPQYGDENDALAVRQVQEMFPDREVVGVQTREVAFGGGNIHCITQQQETNKKTRKRRPGSPFFGSPGVFCLVLGAVSSGRPFFIRNVSPTAYVPSSFFFCLRRVLSFNSERKYPKRPLETDGFKTSFVECKSCFLNPAEARNWSASTHAAALLGG